MVCKNKENGVTGALTMDDGILLCQFSQLFIDVSPPPLTLREATGLFIFKETVFRE
jgi:hypothetical protein